MSTCTLPPATSIEFPQDGGPVLARRFFEDGGQRYRAELHEVRGGNGAWFVDHWLVVVSYYDGSTWCEDQIYPYLKWEEANEALWGRVSP